MGIMKNLRLGGAHLPGRYDFLVTTIQDLPQIGESINEEIARLWQFCNFLEGK